MNHVSKIEGNGEITPQQQFRSQLDRMGSEFAAALPEHINADRFKRVVMTAVLSDPNIMRADRKSLMEAAMRAAQDGLLPDKREGAFVLFKSTVQWMPMIGGIIKKLHQSGDVALITAKVVYGGDNYRTWVDDDGEHVIYEPAEMPDHDTIRQVFAMAKMRDGTVYVEAMTPRDIEKIRSVSRSKNGGPWAQWWEEMAKKSAIRRLSKRLNLSPEIHDLIQRDNAMYDLSQAPDPRPSLQERFAARQQEAIEADEGFNASQIAYDGGPAPETPQDDDSTIQQSGPDASPSDEPETVEHDAPTEEDGGKSADDPSSSDLFPDSAGDPPPSPDRGEEGGEVPPPASSPSTLSDADLKVLRVFAKSILPLTAVQGTTGKMLQAIEDRQSVDIKQLSEKGREAAHQISVSVRAIMKGDTSLDSAAMHFAEVLDMDERDLTGGAS